jgi:predicted transcriptional regulator
MAENDIDDILEVLENPTRRMILRELAREPRYSLQLAQMLNVSQQAIMKHLRVMEDREMVRVIIEKSDAGGPPRKCYLASKRFSITIDMGPGLFEEVVRTFGESGGEVEREGDIREPEEARAMLADTLDGLERVDAAMENLDARRTLLLDEKERLMKTARRRRHEARASAHHRGRRDRRGIDCRGAEHAREGGQERAQKADVVGAVQGG